MYLLHIKQLVLFKRFPSQIEPRHLDLPNLYLNVKISVNFEDAAKTPGINLSGLNLSDPGFSR